VLFLCAHHNFAMSQSKLFRVSAPQFLISKMGIITFSLSSLTENTQEQDRLHTSMSLNRAERSRVQQNHLNPS